MHQFYIHAKDIFIDDGLFSVEDYDRNYNNSEFCPF